MWHSCEMTPRSLIFISRSNKRIIPRPTKLGWGIGAASDVRLAVRPACPPPVCQRFVSGTDIEIHEGIYFILHTHIP